MEIKVKYMRRILALLLERAQEDPDEKGFRKISEDVGLTDDYLYKKIHLRIKDKAEEDVINPHTSKVSRMLKFLGFNELKEFIQAEKNPIPAQLIKCAGSYYSYVRRSFENGNGTLFRSPVRILEKDRRMIMELKGKRLNYSGSISLRQGCLFIPLESKDGKSFYHVYKIGTSECPEILQGIFSGVSNVFEPIGGRAVLVRVSEEFKKLSNAELEISAMHRSEKLLERRLAEYFSGYSENNLAIKRAYAFDERDLGACK